MSITLTRKEMTHRLQTAFPEPQTEVLVDILDDIRQAELQRAADTLELKEALCELTRQVNKLAGAQQRTEQRVEELVGAQQRTEQRVEELVGAQQRTEQRVEELAEAQKELTQAQTKTDQALHRLEQVVEKGFTDLYRKVGEMDGKLSDLGQAVGQLSNRFGFDLEEFVAAFLPPYLDRHQSMRHLTLEREYFQLPDDQEEEIDLAGTGERDAQPVMVLAECRTSLKGGEARKLIKKLKRVETTLTYHETLLILVAMNIHPSAAKAGAEEGVLMIPYSHIYRPGDFE